MKAIKKKVTKRNHRPGKLFATWMVVHNQASGPDTSYYKWSQAENSKFHDPLEYGS